MGNKTETEARKKWRFYRSQLETIVWDKGSDSALADFSEGHFTTDDPVVAKKLIALGYPEIPLDATEPPPGVVVKKPTHAIDGDVPLVSGNITDPKIIETRMKAKEKVLPGERSVPKPKPKAKPKAKAEEPVSKLRRRKKKPTAK